MKLPAPASLLNRRAALLLPALLLNGIRPPPAFGSQERTTAQTIGLEDSDSSAIPGLVWGGNRRCDPTDASCTQGGREQELAASQPVPPKLGAKLDRVVLDLTTAGSEPLGRLYLGLSREAAPESVQWFVSLAKGQLTTGLGEDPAKLERSNLVRIERDRAVVLGALTQRGGIKRIEPGVTRPKVVPVQPPQTADSNSISHAAAGLLSVRKGGGSFEFTITPRANTNLDRDNIVVGSVLDAESMAVLERLNNLPTNNYDRGPLVAVKVAHVTVLDGEAEGGA